MILLYHVLVSFTFHNIHFNSGFNVFLTLHYCHYTLYRVLIYFFIVFVSIDKLFVYSSVLK